MVVAGEQEEFGQVRQKKPAATTRERRKGEALTARLLLPERFALWPDDVGNIDYIPVPPLQGIYHRALFRCIAGKRAFAHTTNV